MTMSHEDVTAPKLYISKEEELAPTITRKQTTEEWLAESEDNVIEVYDINGELVGIKTDANDLRSTEEVAAEFNL